MVFVESSLRARAPTVAAGYIGAKHCFPSASLTYVDVYAMLRMYSLLSYIYIPYTKNVLTDLRMKDLQQIC